MIRCQECEKKGTSLITTVTINGPTVENVYCDYHANLQKGTTSSQNGAIFNRVVVDFIRLNERFPTSRDFAEMDLDKAIAIGKPTESQQLADTEFLSNFFETNGILVSLLEELAARTADFDRLACTFESPQPVRLKNERTAMEIYIVACMAVDNVIKHAKANRIQIGLKEDDRSIMLSVQQEGSGHDDLLGEATETGMQTLGCIAESMRGQLSIESMGPCGTIMTFAFPKGAAEEHKTAM